MSNMTNEEWLWLVLLIWAVLSVAWVLFGNHSSGSGGKR